MIYEFTTYVRVEAGDEAEARDKLVQWIAQPMDTVYSIGMDSLVPRDVTACSYGSPMSSPSQKGSRISALTRPAPPRRGCATALWRARTSSSTTAGVSDEDRAELSDLFQVLPAVVIPL